jgi:hypothetical protein
LDDVPTEDPKFGDFSIPQSDRLSMTERLLGDAFELAADESHVTVSKFLDNAKKNGNNDYRAVLLSKNLLRD